MKVCLAITDDGNPIPAVASYGGGADRSLLDFVFAEEVSWLSSYADTWISSAVNNFDVVNAENVIDLLLTVSRHSSGTYAMRWAMKVNKQLVYAHEALEKSEYLDVTSIRPYIGFRQGTSFTLDPYVYLYGLTLGG
jgi:hypothetical protein